jgi:hypothetical protein
MSPIRRLKKFLEKNDSLRASFLCFYCFCWFLWLLLRTGRKPSRIAYPCQRAAAAQSLVLVVAAPHLVRELFSFLSQKHFRRKIWRMLPVMLFALLAAWSASLALDHLQAEKNREQLLKLKQTLSKPLSAPAEFSVMLAAIGSPHRVVMVHDSLASSWKGQAPDYWNMIDESEVDLMVYAGLKSLTDKNTISEAWQALIPNYLAHQKIAIKINNNNSGMWSTDWGTPRSSRIDAIIEPVNALAKSLLEAFGPNIAAEDIWVFESYRRFYGPEFMERALPGIQFYSAVDSAPAGVHLTGFSGARPNSNVSFRFMPGLSLPLNDALVDADYLIDMPIVKKHGSDNATLSFKNHFGSIMPDGGISFSSEMHNAIDVRHNNALVDISANPHIKDKTVLILGDGIIGGRRNNYEPPDLWSVRFPEEGSPEMLFFAIDPVAADSVMADLLLWERGSEDVAKTRNYMLEAMDMGLGVAEVGTWTGTTYPNVNIQYNNIDFVHVRLPAQQTFGDINNDGSINSGDAILALRISAGLEIGGPPHQATAEERSAGDVNCDGLNNSGDAILILRKAAGLIISFPCN